MARVLFKFEDKSIEDVLVEDAEKGFTIQEITEDNNIHLNHNCGCVCACSTCHVYILQGEDSFGEISDREEDFIDRAINPRIESRLACQCIIQSDDADIIIEVPDQDQIIGHEH